MKLTFIPLDYDYVTIDNKVYMKIFGKTKEGKTCCIIDSAVNFFYILSENPEKILNKIQNIPDVKKAEIVNKNYQEKPVKAIKIFCEYNKMQETAHKIKNMDSTANSRERDINIITRYIMESKIKPLVWYNIQGEIITDTEFKGISNSLDTDIVLKLEKSEESKEQPEFKPKILAFDIEVKELEIGRSEILMISLVSDKFKKVITWKKCSKAKKYVECLKDEAETIEKFHQYVKEINPDIITGYFSDGFDFPYLRARAEKNGIDLRLGKDNSRILFSRGRPLNARIKGIIHIDLLKFIETVYSQYLQSETLGLNEVANELIGKGKLEVDHFKETHEYKEHEWQDYFEYNLQDSLLTYQLFEKLWPDMLEFAKIIQEPLYNITRYSMSHLVENYFIHNLERFNEIAEKRPIHEEIQKRRQRPKYVGAFVFQPEANLYENLAIFDFTSYWPSIIVTFNLSKTTFLEKKEKNSLEVDLNGKKVYFSKKQGFIPKLLAEIIDLRKKYKKELKQKPDPIKKVRSNAYKLLANATYGYQGFFGARWYCPEASASTTAISRNFIQEIIKKTNKEGYKVIYADSVDGKTKVFIKNKEDVYEKKIEELFKRVDRKKFGKEYNFNKKIKVLTLDKHGKSVFKPVRYIMRHKSKKKMYRVHFTNNWFIDVTEDHSLMAYQSSKFNQSKKNKKNILRRIIKIKPEEVGKKASTIVALKKIPYNKQKKTKDYPKEIYEFMGYFIGDGSFSRNKSHKRYNKDYYIRLSTGLDKAEIIKRLIKPLIKRGYIKNYWESKTRKGDITFNGLKLVRLISKDLRNGSGKKIIPDWLFEEKEENIAAFLRGLFSADGCVMFKKGVPSIKYTSTNEGYIKNSRKLLYRVGISNSIFKENSINKYKDKKQVYSKKSISKNLWVKDRKLFAEKIGFLLERKNKLCGIRTDGVKKRFLRDFEFDTQSIKKIEKIKTPKYVYDLEVEDTHTFFANNILVHNTDGFAFLLNKKSKKQTLDFLKKLNSKLPGIMELELEDFYKRGIWVTKRTGEFGAKKKYALINYEDKLKIRGFETVRRDWCTLARQVQNKILDKILKDGNEKSALKYLKGIIKKIKKREIDRKLLIIKTQLKKPLSEYLSEGPHVAVAKKMQKLGLPVDVGMLITYYVAEVEDKRARVRDRARLIDEKGRYDIEYYLKRQILPAVENIFEVFDINVKELLEDSKQKKLDGF